jgi:hypothetical protein
MLSLQISCGPGITCSSIYGYLTVIMAFVIFIGSVYLLLSAVFGVRMGYLVLAVCFFGWMILFSAIWVFGTGAPNSKNLGPRGVEPHWQPVAVGITATSQKYPMVKNYPNRPWRPPTASETSDTQDVQTSIQLYMANQGNLNNGIAPNATNALQTTDFTVENVEFTQAGNTMLAAAQAFYNFGGPKVTVVVYHDAGDVPSSICRSWTGPSASARRCSPADNGLSGSGRPRRECECSAQDSSNPEACSSSSSA